MRKRRTMLVAIASDEDADNLIRALDAMRRQDLERGCHRGA